MSQNSDEDMMDGANENPMLLAPNNQAPLINTNLVHPTTPARGGNTGTTSRDPLMITERESATHSSGGGYLPPAQYYKSECQTRLDAFLRRMKEETDGKKLERDDPQHSRENSGQYSEDEERIKEDKDSNWHLFKPNAPIDATGCTQI